MAIYLGRESLINKKQNILKLTKYEEKGYDGEIGVGDLLTKYLPADTYLISHPVIGKYDPDFLVISPRYGFRMIEVKNWSLKPIKFASPNGSLEVGGDTQNPLSQVRNHIEDLNRYLMSSNLELQNSYQLIGCIVINYGFSKKDFTSKFPPDKWNSIAAQEYYKCHIFKDQLDQNIDRLLQEATKYPRSSSNLFNDIVKRIADELCISDKLASETEIEILTKTSELNKITSELTEKLNEQDLKTKELCETIEKNSANSSKTKKTNNLIFALAGVLLALFLIFSLNNNIFFNQSVKSPSTTQLESSGPQGRKIKGNISSKGDKIYHIPGGKYYEQTNPEEWFFTEDDAQTAGFRKSQL